MGAKLHFGKRIALACLLAACGAKAPAPAQQPAARGVYDPHALDLDRPCTLVTAEDAAAISGMPFYRTMVANSIEEGQVRCAQGVGEYGLHGMVEAEMRYARPGAGAPDLYAAACRTPASPADVAAPLAEGESAPPPVRGQNCEMKNGAFALLLPDRVLLVRVRLSAGEIDPAASRRLASLVSQRLP